MNTTDSFEAKNITTYVEFVKEKTIENESNVLHQSIIKQLESRYFGILKTKFATPKNTLHIQHVTSTSSKLSKLQYEYFVELLNKGKQSGNEILIFYAYKGADITRLISLIERYQNGQQNIPMYTQFNTFSTYNQQIETNELLKLHKTINVPIFVVSLVLSKKTQESDSHSEQYKSIELTLVDQLGFNKQQLI